MVSAFEQALGHPPSFELGERDSRFAVVRTRMREMGLDALIAPHATGDWDNLQPDTRYLTQVGGGGVATALIFPLTGEPIVAVREERRAQSWAKAQNWVSDVRWPRGLDWASFFVDGLKERGLDRQRIGVLGLDGYVREPQGTFGHKIFDQVAAAFPKAEFVSATSMMTRVRKTKSKAEIAMLERAQACADAITDGLARIEPGYWLHEVYADMTAAAIRWGAEMPSMMLLGCGETMFQTQLQPEFRRVEQNDILIVEAEPKFYGYAAQSIRTVAMRQHTTVENGILQASRECFEALRALLKPGHSYKELFPVWHAVAARHGYRAGRSLGHATGLGQDRPWTTHAGALWGDDFPIEEGDCFILKPWISTEDEAISGRVGDVIVVTASGGRRLSRHDLI